MHKLIILIEAAAITPLFEDNWPNFLSLAERMPGLVREATSHIDTVLYGSYPFALMHELLFETPGALQEAMGSEEGRLAGELLQHITDGRLALYMSDHKEDELENIRKFRAQDGS